MDTGSKGRHEKDAVRVAADSPMHLSLPLEMEKRHLCLFLRLRFQSVHKPAKTSLLFLSSSEEDTQRRRRNACRKKP